MPCRALRPYGGRRLRMLKTGLVATAILTAVVVRQPRSNNSQTPCYKYQAFAQSTCLTPQHCRLDAGMRINFVAVRCSHCLLQLEIVCLQRCDLVQIVLQAVCNGFVMLRLHNLHIHSVAGMPTTSGKGVIKQLQSVNPDIEATDSTS